MKIRSDFKDYYDSLMTHDNNDIIYNRFTVVEKSDLYDYYSSRYVDELIVNDITIGFCGQIYQTLYVTSVKTKQNKFCYNINDVDTFILGNFSKKQYEEYVTSIYGAKHWKYNTRFSFEKYFEHTSLNNGWRQRFYKTLFNDKTPIFVARPYKKEIAFNASLRDVEFFRVMDPYQTFQEIEMYLNNQAEPRKPIPKIDDVTMAEAKGFNKWSFRKESTKK